VESLTKLAIPIYQKLSKKYSSLSESREATKQYILTEIIHWNIKSSEQEGNYFYKPIEFKETKDSKPFQVRLINKGETRFIIKKP